MAIETMIQEPTLDKMNWLSINENKESLILVPLITPSKKICRKLPVGVHPTKKNRG
jgi:hypothetical protein